MSRSSVRGRIAVSSVRVPATLRLPDNPFQWTGVLPIYREQLIEWGGQAQAIPLAGDGFVVVYRVDRLADAKFVEAFQAAARTQTGRSCSLGGLCRSRRAVRQVRRQAESAADEQSCVG